MVHVNIDIPDDLHKRLRLAAVNNDTTIKAIVNGVLAKTGERVER